MPEASSARCGRILGLGSSNERSASSLNIEEQSEDVSTRRPPTTMAQHVVETLLGDASSEAKKALEPHAPRPTARSSPTETGPPWPKMPRCWHCAKTGLCLLCPYYVARRCAARRLSWPRASMPCEKMNDGTDVTTKYPNQVTTEYKRYGFLLRALPPSRLSFPEPPAEGEAELRVGSEEKADEAVEDEATLKPDDAEVEVKPVNLDEYPDSELLAQLELSRAAELMRQLKALKRSRHDISKFQFFDLKQATKATEEELTEWQKQEEADKEVDQQGFQILSELLRILARAAGYAAQRQADQLLQASLVTWT
eukprot:g21702.t1